MPRNEDRRIKRTKKAMTEALAKLLLEKPLNNISVREIAEIADINRGTFYLHYRDVYDMAEHLQNEIFEKFNEIVENHEPKNSSDYLFPLLAELFNLLSENAALARVLISKNGDAVFVDKLKQVIREKCFVNIREELNIKSDDEFDYFYNYIVSGCIGICSTWLNNGMKEEPKEMALLAERLIKNSALAYDDNVL